MEKASRRKPARRLNIKPFPETLRKASFLGRLPKSGRPDRVDEMHHELYAALAARAALEKLRESGEKGRRQAALLEETYVARGMEGQKHLCAAFGGRPKEGEEAHELAGILSSPLALRARYQRVGGLAREALRRRGSKKLKEALLAYRETRSALLERHPPPTRPG